MNSFAATDMVDAVGTTVYSYDSVGQLLNEDGPWANDTVSYSYTNRLRIALSLSQPSGSWSQSYGYDAVRRLTNVTSQAGAFGYQYSGLGPSTLVSRLALPNGAFITNTFDSVARLLSTVLKNSGNTALDSESYAYNQANQRTAQTNTAGDFRNYIYDNEGELVSAIGKEPGGTTNRLNEQFGYAYDGAGNLNFRTNNALVQTFNVNSLNELATITNNGTLTVAGTTTVPATNVTVNGLTANRYADAAFALSGFTISNGLNSFTAVGWDSVGNSSTNSVTVNLPATNSYVYDLNGNLVTNGNQILDYDDENELIRVTVTNSFKKEYTYDGQHRLRIRKEYGWINSAWTQTNEIRYVWDGDTFIQTRDVNNSPVLTFTRGNDFSGMPQGAGGIGGLLAMTENSRLVAGDAWAHSYYHADGNGNITCLISTNKSVVGKYLYDPFGNPLSESGSKAFVNPIWFSSQIYDPDTGFLHFKYRIYIPELQRWLNRDPIQEPGGLNLYIFVHNRPTDKRDLDGRDENRPPVSINVNLSTGTSEVVYPYFNINPNASPSSLIAVAMLPLAAFGGEVIAGALVANEIGTGTAIVYSGVWGSSMSVAGNTTSQLMENGGNWGAINSNKQLLSGGLGFAFGLGSGELTVWGNSIEQAAAANAAQIEAQAAFAGSVGPYLGMSQEDIDAAILQAELFPNQIESLAQLQTGALSTMDTFGLPWAEDYAYDQLLVLMGHKPPCR